MQEPSCLSPREIDLMTLRQIALYYEDDASMAYDEAVERVQQYRREQGLIPPDHP